MSLFRSIRQQLGLSVTPANNFTLDASANNGTMKLARGNAGATTQDVMTVAADGKVTFPQNTVEVVGGGNHFGYKYPDGTLICTVVYSGALSLSAYGGGLSVARATFTYAVPFVGPPPIISGFGTDGINRGWLAPDYDSTNSAVSWSYYSVTTPQTVPSCSIAVRAIGRWK